MPPPIRVQVLRGTPRGTTHPKTRCLFRKCTASFLGAQASRLPQERAGSPRSQEVIHWRRAVYWQQHAYPVMLVIRASDGTMAG